LNSGDTILNSATVTVTKPVSVFANGDVFKAERRKTIDDTGIVTDKR
jgi:hypothetical protein